LDGSSTLTRMDIFPKTFLPTGINWKLHEIVRDAIPHLKPQKSFRYDETTSFFRQVSRYSFGYSI